MKAQFRVSSSELRVPTLKVGDLVQTRNTMTDIVFRVKTLDRKGWARVCRVREDGKPIRGAAVVMYHSRQLQRVEIEEVVA